MPANDQRGRPNSDAVAGGAVPPPGVVPPPGAEHASVDAQLRTVDDALADLSELPVDAQVAAFTDLHQQLTAALAVTATAAGPADEPPRQHPGPPRHRGS